MRERGVRPERHTDDRGGPPGVRQLDQARGGAAVLRRRRRSGGAWALKPGTGRL